MGGEYQDLKFQVMIDRFKQEHEDLFGTVFGSQEIEFDSDMARLEYPWEITPEFSVISSVDYQRQNNWHAHSQVDLTPILGVSDLPFQMESKLDRYQFVGHYRHDTDTSVNAGVMYQQERAHVIELRSGPSSVSTYFDGSDKESYQTHAAFFQTDWLSDIGSWSVGGRYSDHSLVGESWVPRISFVRHWYDWHVKALYSHSFREPEFMINQLGEGTLNPEIAKTIEVELGRQVSPNMVVAINVFSATVEDPIIYSVVDTDLNVSTGMYRNYGDMSSRGLEASWHWQPQWGELKLGYSFYEAFDNPVPEYQVPGKDEVFLGAASHKLTLSSRYNISSQLSLNPSAIWTSPRYGYDYDPAVVTANLGDPKMSLKKFNSQLTLNFFMDYHTGPFTLGVGLFDALNVKHEYLQAYDGDGSPLPGPGRMMYVKLVYTPNL